MMFSTALIAALGALPLAFASYPYYPSSNATVSYPAAPTGTGSPTAQTVAVGQDGLVFTPDTITAKIGEKIIFQFFPKNHSIVQADFNNPCNPSDNALISGFIPTVNGPAAKTFTITLQDDKPIWLYCAALQPRPHCAAGMVAVINPPAQGPNTLDAFRDLAKRTNTSTVPIISDGGDVIAPTPSRTGAPQLSTGAASSIAVGGGAFGGLIAMLGVLLL